MFVTDEEANELKTWVVKKLEDISDADSDVLADYVLALIRAETPEPELRLSAIENLEDFLKDSTTSFVDEIFAAIHSKAYKPGYVPQPSVPPTGFPSATASSTSTSLYGTRNPSFNPTPQSRKRSYYDRQNDGGTEDLENGHSDRQTKQIRRAGGRGGAFDVSARRGTEQPNRNAQAALPPTVQQQFPNAPNLLSGFPGDPNDPMFAMMAQALGLPLPSTMPSKTTAGSPPNFSQLNPNGTMPMEGKLGVQCLDYNTKGFCARGNTCPFEHGNDHMIVPNQDGRSRQQSFLHGCSLLAEYDPKDSLMKENWTTSRTNGHDGQDTTRSSAYANNSGGGQGNRGAFGRSRRTNRAEFSQAGPSFDKSNTKIVVEQIPEEKFDEESVRSFFSEFGTIENVDMRPYKRLAIVKYSDYWAARRAYESPKVIFDNRFVKVYWYKPEALKISGEPRNGSISDISPTSPQAGNPSFDKEEFERNAIAAQKKLEEKKAMVKDAEEKRRALEKQKEELAQRQAEEKRKLLEKLAAKGEVAATNVDESANVIGQEKIADDKATAQTKALRAQLAALEAEARSLGLDTALTEDPYSQRGRGRGQGAYRGRESFSGRGRYNGYRGSPRGRGWFRGGGAYNLDNRTKKIGISGVEFNGEKDEALRQYLLGIGDFEAIEPHPDQPGVQVITFKDRQTAEMFMYGGKNIPSIGPVELSWINTPLAPASLGNKFNSDVDMGTGSSKMNGDHAEVPAAEVDYDVAEEDDRWMAG
ncbi:MAG: hypothetical protein LQ342_003897 [Letrouitia transgressa]|nr:MAG: hypothetical protein LQ342_003897 [Letrouitia transgressa]